MREGSPMGGEVCGVCFLSAWTCDTEH